MRRKYRVLSFLLLFGLVLSMGAFASSEASEDPSGEPSREMDISLTITEEEAEPLLLSVHGTVDGSVYTFRLGEFLEMLGVTMTYDPETRTVKLDHIPTLPGARNTAS